MGKAVTMEYPWGRIWGGANCSCYPLDRVSADGPRLFTLDSDCIILIGPQ
jgi:hypothetical protein